MDKSSAKESWTGRTIRVGVSRPGEEEEQTVLAQPFARVGSHAGNDVVLTDEGVPPRGLYLHATDAGIYCLSLFNTRAGGTKALGWLGPRNFATLGDWRVRCTFADGGPAARTDLHELHSRSTLSPAPGSLVLAAPSEDEIRQPIHRRLTLVGRQAPCKMRLHHSSISDSHCVLYWQAGTLWVVDLVSDEGTHVAGQRVTCDRVPAGEVLTLGRVPLRLLLQGESVPGTQAETTDTTADRYFSSRTITGDESLERLLRHLHDNQESPAHQSPEV